MTLTAFERETVITASDGDEYIWRAGKKSKETELQDLRKARENIDFEIARVEADRG